jgi:hypothetical protein
VRPESGLETPPDGTASALADIADGVGVDMEAVWATYRDGINQLGRAEVAAREEREAAEHAWAEAVHQAEQDLAAARADREELETELGLFEQRVHRILDSTGVAPEGAGAGTISARVDDVAGARATMAEITTELDHAAAALTSARAARDARQRGALATGIVCVAVVITLVWLNLLSTNTFATGAGAVLIFATTMLGRRRGPLTAGITAAVTLTAVVLTATLVGPVLATIALTLTAVIAVIVLIRPRPRHPAVSSSRLASPNSGGSRV